MNCAIDCLKVNRSWLWQKVKVMCGSGVRKGKTSILWRKTMRIQDIFANLDFFYNLSAILWTIPVKPINCKFFAVEQIRLITSTIYWWLSWQRYYALIFRQPGWYNDVKCCCDLTSCKSWLTFTWKTMVQLGTQLWSKMLARRYTPVPNGSGCARLKKNLDQRENLTLWRKYSFRSK